MSSTAAHLLDGFHLDAIRLDDGPACQMSHDSGSLYELYWLLNRDSYTGLLESQYN